MRIEQVTVTLPSRKVTNGDVIQEFERASSDFQGNIRGTARYIEKVLLASGSDIRYWLEEGETPLELTLRACRAAMTHLPDNTIDLVIWASVYGELVEPATSNLVASTLGLDTAECFDMKEACDGWMKAVKIADALIKTGQYRRVMVINSEFSMTPNFAIRPRLFNFSSAEELKWRFPIFTIGEGVAVTILSADAGNEWGHTNLSRNDLYDLCTVPAAWHAGGGSDRVAKDGPGWFTSWAAELSGEGIPLAVETFKRSGINPDGIDILFTHASSKRDWTQIATDIGLQNKLFDIYTRCGNLVSASVPAAMALAIEDGVLSRGNRVAVLVGSAGMTFSAASFNF